ncbi:origin recognition complex subunit 3-like [Pollicipes pollicipes]|uniref:origin recognition complex subunit 3-like n=1 Tax=Pollicipes pollicipes TaxID=41117 RepID=UPI001884B32C|nr:origin recognition complex subunit 3-like [Pollicipes pollicipes]
MSATSSLTKSCFVFKPKLKRVQAEEFDGSQQFAACADETAALSAGRRSAAFGRVWGVAQQLCSDFQDKMFSTVFQDMIAFLQRSVDAEEEACIPTAALVTGVNMPDHGRVFASLAARLRAQVGRHVALLEPASCPTVSATVRAMVRQLTDPDQGVQAGPDSAGLEDDEEGEPLAWESERLHQGRPPATMPGLEAHYQALQAEATTRSPAKTGSPRKRARTSPACRPLVVVWRDLEAFQPRVLQDVVLICSQYRRRLPIAFVFGVSTCASVVHRLLPQHVSARLSLEKFHSQLATHYLAQIIDKVVLSPAVPFRLGGRALRLLLDIFLYSDFSVNNFISAYKYCMLQHFLTSPASVLCCGREAVAATVAALSPERRRRLQQDAPFREWLEQAVLELHTGHDALLLALRCLFALVGRLPGAPLGRQFRELYNLALLQPLAESDEYALSVKLLGLLSRAELTASLEAALLAVGAELTDSDLGRALERHLERLRAPDAPPPDTGGDGDGDDDAQQRRMLERQLKQATSRQSLRESLQRVGAAQSRRLNPYESLRAEVVTDLDGRLRALLSRPAGWPLHEAVMFDTVSAVRRQLVGVPRTSVQTALADPAKYLQCSCCKLSDPGSVLASMPDLCVVYKLHLECGRLINLFDWMQAFRAVVAAEEDEALQARFAHAVAELQYLGFIRSTQKKTDHVARLTWGSC